MKHKADAFTILRSAVAALAVLLTLIALFFPKLIEFRIGRLRVGAFDVIALAVPTLALLLIFECIRSIRRSVGIRRQSSVLDQQFYDEFRSRDRGRMRSVAEVESNKPNESA